MAEKKRLFSRKLRSSAEMGRIIGASKRDRRTRKRPDDP
jgi:hypothetical protein